MRYQATRRSSVYRFLTPHSNDRTVVRAKDRTSFFAGLVNIRTKRSHSIMNRSKRTRPAQRRKQLRSIEWLLKDGDDLLPEMREDRIAGEDYDTNSLIVELVDQ